MGEHFIELGSMRIRWLDSEGTGPAALLVHGNSMSASTFKHQLDGPLGQRYRLVALDLPGHGGSSRADRPGSGYTLRGLAGVVSRVAAALELSRALFVGWSLGGHLLMEALDTLDEAAGFVIFGAPPLAGPSDLGQAFLPHPALSSFFKADLNAEELTAICAACLCPAATGVPESLERAIRQADPTLRQVLGESVARGDFKDEVRAVCGLRRPVAFLHGAKDQLVNSSYLGGLQIPALWRGAVQQIAGAGHAPHLERPEAFNALLAEILAEIAS